MNLCKTYIYLATKPSMGQNISNNTEFCYNFKCEITLTLYKKTTGFVKQRGLSNIDPLFGDQIAHLITVHRIRRKSKQA